MAVFKQLGLAAAVSVVLASSVHAQPKAPTGTAPVRAVYVTGQDGNPKIYYVTGTVPPEKLPTVVPAPPSSIPPVLPPSANGVSPVRSDVPTHIVPAPVAAMPVEAANCPTGHCGKKCKHGATSFWECARTPATVPPPLGSSNRSVFEMQRDNALAEYFVIYREDWLDAKSMLNDTGARHVDGVVRRFGTIGASVKVEPTGIAELDQKRVMAVVEKLVQSGIPPQEAGGRVVLGTSRAEGLRYRDIENLYNRSGSGGSGGGYGSGFGGIGIGGFGGFGGIGGLGIR